MIRSLLRSSLCSLSRTKVSPIEKLVRVSRITSSSSRGIHITSTDLKEFRVGSQKVRSTDLGKHVVLDGEDTVEVQSSSEQWVTILMPFYRILICIILYLNHVCNVLVLVYKMFVNSRTLIHPDAFTPDMLFDNVPFKQLHIINIKSTPNNTIMTTTDAMGKF